MAAPITFNLILTEAGNPVANASGFMILLELPPADVGNPIAGEVQINGIIQGTLQVDQQTSWKIPFATDNGGKVTIVAPPSFQPVATDAFTYYIVAGGAQPDNGTGYGLTLTQLLALSTSTFQVATVPSLLQYNEPAAPSVIKDIHDLIWGVLGRV